MQPTDASTRALEGVPAILQQMASATDPLRMIEVFERMQQSRGNGNDSMVTLLMQMMMEERKENRRLIEKLSEAKPVVPAAPVKSAMETLIESAEAYDKLEALFGKRQNTARKPHWLESIGPYLGPMVSPLMSQLFSGNAAETPAPAAAVDNMPRRGMAVVPPAPQPEPAAAPPPGPATSHANAQAAVQFGSIVLRELKNGAHGESLAHTIVTLYGEEAYNGMIEDKAEGILKDIRTHAPEIAAQIEAHPRCSEYLDEFLHAFDEDEEEDEQER